MTTFRGALQGIEDFKQELLDLWNKAYKQAVTEIGGNWQDPSVMRRRRERADAICDGWLENQTLVLELRKPSNG